MGKFSDIEKMMKDLDAKYQKKWDEEKKKESISVNLHITDIKKHTSNIDIDEDICDDES